MSHSKLLVLGRTIWRDNFLGSCWPFSKERHCFIYFYVLIINFYARPSDTSNVSICWVLLLLAAKFQIVWSAWMILCCVFFTFRFSMEYVFCNFHECCITVLFLQTIYMRLRSDQTRINYYLHLWDSQGLWSFAHCLIFQRPVSKTTTKTGIKLIQSNDWFIVASTSLLRIEYFLHLQYLMLNWNGLV